MFYSHLPREPMSPWYEIHLISIELLLWREPCIVSHKGNVVDWSKLALDLGYFDQAHFIKDFKTIVGKAPVEYTQKLQP
jgi:AraC-like DNA-binding protein